MTERIGYDVNQEGIIVALPKAVGEQIISSDDASLIMTWSGLERRSRMFDFKEIADGYEVFLDFKRAGYVGQARPEDYRAVLHQLTLVHREIIETAGADYQNGGMQLVYGVPAGYRTPHPLRADLYFSVATDEAREGLTQAVTSDMRRMGGFLLPHHQPYTVDSHVWADFTEGEIPTLHVHTPRRAGMFGGDRLDPFAETFDLTSFNLSSRTEELVCISGLASFAKHRSIC